MFEEVGSWFEHGSYAGIFLGMVLTGLGLPIPEEAFVLFAGMAAAQGVLKNPVLALATCFAGAIVGDMITYMLGRHFGYGVLREHPIIAKHLTPERERHLEQLIKRHGFKVFFISRFLVGVRSPVYLTAGILRVPMWWFLLVDTFSATVVVGSFFGLSYFFADRMQVWWQWIRQAELALTVVIITAGLIAFVLLYRKYKQKTHGQPEVLLDQALRCHDGKQPTEASLTNSAAVDKNGRADKAKPYAFTPQERT